MCNYCGDIDFTSKAETEISVPCSTTKRVCHTTNWHPLNVKPWKSIANITVGEGVTVWRQLVTAAVVCGLGTSCVWNSLSFFFMGEIHV